MKNKETTPTFCITGALEKYKPSLDRVRCYRLKHYYDLVNRKPEQERFIYGWYKRALSV